MGNKDLSEFLLAEYENVAKAFFNTYDIAARWFKYYLVVLAVPFSFIALFYHNNTEKFYIFNLPISIAILVAGVGIANIFVSYIIVDQKLDSILYARAVNGIRKYFVELGIKNLDFASADDAKRYIVLPIETNKPNFIQYNSDLCIQAVFMSLMNAVYFSGGLVQIEYVKKIYIQLFNEALAFSIILIITVTMQMILFRYQSEKKEKEYCKAG